MGHDLIALGSAFVGAGLAAKLGRRLRLPTIPFFMAAGLLLGPNSPGVAMVGDADVLELLAALGLILLLFHLGLEFDLEDFIANAPRLLAAGGGYIAINVGAGLLLGFALGWGTVHPAAFPSVAAPALIAVLLALATNLAAGLLAARLNGLDARRGVNAGLTLLARGEFALILAALAAAAGLDPRIGPFAGLYVLVLAVVGPLAAAQAPRIGDVLDRAVARHGPSAH